MFKAVIFDVGGTLLGATDLIENILACSNVDPKTRKGFYDQLGNVFLNQIADCRNGAPFIKVVEMIDQAIKVINQEHGNCLASVNAQQVYWQTFVDDSFVIHDADITLEKLYEKKIEMFIASDADAELIYAQFKKHGWNKYIRSFFISSELRDYKPGDAFVASLHNIIRDYAPNEVLMVGDSVVDVETGKKLGIRTVLIGSRQNRFNENYSIVSLLELLNLE